MKLKNVLGTSSVVLALLPAVVGIACGDDNGGSTSGGGGAGGEGAAMGKGGEPSSAGHGATASDSGSGGQTLGGASNEAECQSDADCEPSSECEVTTCTAGVCEATPVAAGTPVGQQQAGDCVERQCSGGGEVEIVSAEDDVLDDGNPCTEDTCEAGEPVSTPLEIGASCGELGQTCDAQARCCGTYQYRGAATDVLAIRVAFEGTDQYFVSRFDVTSGTYDDLFQYAPPLAAQIALGREGELLFQSNSYAFGQFSGCMGDIYTPTALTPPPALAGALAAASPFGAIAYDSDAQKAYTFAYGGVGAIFSYDPSTGDWAEVGPAGNYDALSAAYDATRQKLFTAPFASEGSWARLARFSTAGVKEADIDLTSALQAPEGVIAVSLQLKSRQGILYLLMQGRRNVDDTTWSKLVSVDPDVGTPEPIAETP